MLHGKLLNYAITKLSADILHYPGGLGILLYDRHIYIYSNHQFWTISSTVLILCKYGPLMIEDQLRWVGGKFVVIFHGKVSVTSRYVQYTLDNYLGSWCKYNPSTWKLNLFIEAYSIIKRFSFRRALSIK